MNKEIMNTNKNFTFIDLFSGIGGFRMALNSIGGHCINFSEINNDAINTYCINANEAFQNNLGDITKIKALPSHDLLTAGVPCQSWSIAGKNLGFDDDRGQLWNDTLYLLNQSKPKAFIFENVKGLVDPRNKEALTYILSRIKEAGYFANYYVLNSYDYGVPQNRIRIYIIGFKEKEFAKNFKLPKQIDKRIKLGDILTDYKSNEISEMVVTQKNLFGESVLQKSMSLSSSNGFNDYFLFNDLRNGHSTIHSWDIINTSEKQKKICYLLLKNRRKSAYGELDGNPLSLSHFKALDSSINQDEINELVSINILQEEEYCYAINNEKETIISYNEKTLLSFGCNDQLIIDKLKSNKELLRQNIDIKQTIKSLKDKKIISCIEWRYDFKNTKISTGLNGVNRIFLPSSDIFPTLVASDSNDFITTKDIKATNEEEFKKQFLAKIYNEGNYRKITKEEACLIQGFPKNFILPEARARWMKLLGNSVSVPVIKALGEAIINTGVFDENHKNEMDCSLAYSNNLEISNAR